MNTSIIKEKSWRKKIGFSKPYILAPRCHVHCGVEYLRKIYTEFENTLACLSRAWMDLNPEEKIGGQKFRDTLPSRLLVNAYAATVIKTTELINNKSQQQNPNNNTSKEITQIYHTHLSFKTTERSNSNSSYHSNSIHSNSSCNKITECNRTRSIIRLRASKAKFSKNLH